jgi:cytidylate kinase
MIVTISGEPGAGKSSCARGLAAGLKLARYSTGDLMRKMAAERGKKLEELSRDAEHSFDIDRELDERQKLLGRAEDDFVIDGRLSAFFIPHAIKVFLTADLDERARRIHHDGRDEERSESIENAREQILARQNSEIKRYLAWYDFNPYDPKFYDIVFDTTRHSVDETVRRITDAVISVQRRRERGEKARITPGG